MANVFRTARQIDCTTLCEKLEVKGKRTTGNRGRFLCPFHDDHDPSMATYDDGRFYCFTCGAKGDSIDLASRLMGISARDAAAEICHLFGLSYENAVRTALWPTEPPKEVELLVAFLDDWRRAKETMCKREWQAAEEVRNKTQQDDWLWQMYHQKAAHYRTQYERYRCMSRMDVLADLREELVALDIIKERKVPIVGFVS